MQQPWLIKTGGIKVSILSSSGRHSGPNANSEKEKEKEKGHPSDK
jgi:hypothetical protein